MFIVYEFMPGIDDFSIVGGFTKREDAEALKTEMVERKAKCPVIIEQSFAAALDQHLKTRLGPIADAIAGMRLVDGGAGPTLWVLTREIVDQHFSRTEVVGVFQSEERGRAAQTGLGFAITNLAPIVLNAVPAKSGDLGELMDMFSASGVIAHEP